MRLLVGLNRSPLVIGSMIAIGSLLIASHGAGYIFSQSQPQHKMVDERGWPNQPVKILGLKKPGERVKLSEEFDNGEDWLRGVSLEVKNNSERAIVYAEVDLVFYETKATGNPMSSSLRFGRRPWRADDISKIPFRLEPGANADLPITDESYEKLKRFLARRQSISSLNRVTLRLSLVIFDDGQAWGAGNFRCPDPNQPGTYHPVNGKKCS